VESDEEKSQSLLFVTYHSLFIIHYSLLYLTMYEIHLYVPKTGKLTPLMMEWLYEHGQDKGQPETFWPVRKLNPKALARNLLALDKTLMPSPGEDGGVELRYPVETLNISLYVHERGVIISFPFMGSLLLRIVLGICYVYIRYLYDTAGFWSYDPQINVLSYADDYCSIDETAELMDAIMPKLLSSGETESS